MLTLTIFSVATRCLGFIYKIYLAKIMTTNELGIYNITLSVYMVFITIIGASIPLTVSKITAKNKALGQASYTNYSITSALIYNVIMALFLTLLALISKPLITLVIGNSLGYTVILSLLPSIFFTAIYAQLKGYLWGIENYFAVSIVELFEQILKISICVVFIMTNIFNSPIIAVANAINWSCGISTIYGIYLYVKNSGRFQYRNGYFKEIIKSSSPLTCVRLFTSLLAPIISFIIPLRLSSTIFSKAEIISELGVLMGMSMPLLSIPSTIIGALCMILIPKISSENTSQVNKQISYYIIFTISCIFAFIPIFIILGEPICELVFNHIQAGTYLKYFCWVMLPIGLAQITTSILNALNQEYKTFFYFIISNIIMVIFTICFTPLIGPGIIIVGMGIGSILTTVLNVHKIKTILGTNTNILSISIKHSFIILPIILLTRYCYNILSNILSPFITISITGIISVAFYICLLFTFNIINLSTIKIYLNRNTKQTKKVSN